VQKHSEVILDRPRFLTRDLVGDEQLYQEPGAAAQYGGLVESRPGNGNYLAAVRRRPETPARRTGVDKLAVHGDDLRWKGR
jgi:hypothetical protein